MRDILFRGKGTTSLGWHYGSLLNIEGRSYIFNENISEFSKTFSYEGGYRRLENCAFDLVEVDPETVGQSTGIREYEGNKIFEGDILVKLITDEDSCMGRTDKYICKVVYSNGGSELPASFSVVGKGFWRNQGRLDGHGHLNKVIGNIYENPKLLHESMREEIIEKIESWESENLT